MRIVCSFRCPRCRQHFERWLTKPFIAIPGSYNVACPECGKRDISPYAKSQPGDRDYSLPDPEV